MTTTVLITGMGASTAQSVAKALRAQSEIQVQIVGTDIYPRHLSAAAEHCDVHIVVPPVAQREAYRAAILALVELHGVKTIFPIIDAELPFYAGERDVFSTLGATVWVSSPAATDTCASKLATAHVLRARGLPFAETRPLADAGAAPTLAFPLIVKPERGVSSRDVYRVDTADELRVLGARVPDAIVQPFIDGREFTLDVLCDATGQILSVVPRERLEAKAGMATKAVTIRDDRLIALGEQIATALGLVGPANLQCRLDTRSGEFVFFEVNARFASGSPLTLAAGVNQPLILLRHALGHATGGVRHNFQEGVYMARHWAESFSFPPHA